MPSTSAPLRRRLPTLWLALAVLATSVLVPALAQTSTASAATTAPSCGGVTIPKSTGGTWQCTFDDEFDGSSLDSTKWVAQTTAQSGFVNGPECYVNTPNNIAVGGGYLSLTARKEAAPFKCVGTMTSQYTSGMVTTFGKFSQAYGRFEVRAKVPSTNVPGLQETFWLWPNQQTYGSKWPASGEIDIAEFFSRYNNLDIPNVHYVAAVKDPNTTSYKCSISVGDFHTNTLEWNPGTLTISYDGKTCIVDKYNPLGLTSPAPFDKPFFMNLTQALGILTNAFNATTTPLPATTQVDYVRIWK